MIVNYNNHAELYEQTRGIEPIVYSTLSCLLMPAKGNMVLDFGCGTGNYLKQLVLDYKIDPYGIEPSANMRKIAQMKIGVDRIQAGDHSHMPFLESHFEKIYCTDVIHHIQQLDIFFQTLMHVSAPGAQLCICTESISQLSEKYWTKYFPDAVRIDFNRFHPVEDVIRRGQNAGWAYIKTVTTETESNAPISPSFMERVKKKTLSVFRLIPPGAYEQGLVQMETDYLAKTLLHQREGYTFILFERRM